MRRKRIELGTFGTIDYLSQRVQELESVLSELKDAINKPADGKLRVLKKKNTFQYYLRTQAKDTEGVYIKKKNRELARKIAVHEYYSKLIEEIEAEIVALNHTIHSCSDDRIQEIYQKLHPGKQVLVDPIVLDDATYARSWLSVQYSKFDFFDSDESAYFTINGERVRSKSEIVIADALARRDVPYRYEFPVDLSGVGVVRPDFLCLNKRLRKEVIWEHLGLMTNYEYASRNVKKLEGYEKNDYMPGDNLIITMETDTCPLNTRLVDKIIEKYLL